MFGIGMNEMMIILVIAVIIIGPRQIPEIARNLGRLMAQFKRATNDLRTAVNDEISKQIEMDELKEIRQSLDADLYKIESEARSYVNAGMEEEKRLMDEVEGEFASGIAEESTSSGSTEKGTKKKKGTGTGKKTAAKKTGAATSTAKAGSTKTKKATAPAKGGGKSSKTAATSKSSSKTT